jgi:hypothetical protein
MSNHVAITRERISPTRVALVTLGLVPTGAAAGALAGVLGVTLLVSVTDGVRAALHPGLWAVAGLVGGVLGAVLLPIAGLTVLRYVPLGRALAKTIVGTALGGALGVQFMGRGWLIGALAGFGLATIRLRVLAKRARTAGLNGTEPAA